MSLSRKRYELERVFPCLPRTTRGQSIVLGGDPKGKNFLYTYGNSVIIRNIEDPSVVDMYTQHSTPTTVAKYAPSGFYIASADQAGKVRIWDTVNSTHILKNEFQPLSGPIKDLSWSPDSQKLVLVGEGKEKFAHVMSADTGTSLGEMIGHAKAINSCDYKPTRPFKIITGSDEGNIVIHQGPPFKFQATIEEHKKFIFCLRFSPNGNQFASASADGRIVIFDSETYQKVCELGSPAHGGSVYSISWSPSGSHILSSSGDKTAKIWDVNTHQVSNSFKFGNEIDDMQVGNLWQGPFLLTVSLSGHINYLDPKEPEPVRILQGHNRPITSMCVIPEENTFVTGAVDGNAVQWSLDKGKDPKRLAGHPHKSQVNALARNGNTLVSCSVDDTVRFSKVGEAKWGDKIIKLDSQPKAIAFTNDGTAIVACYKSLTFITPEGEIIEKIAKDYEPLSVAVSPDNATLAVGSSKDQKCHIYNLKKSGKSYTIEDKVQLPQGGSITSISFSPDGKHLATANADRRVFLYTTHDYAKANLFDWCFHTSRINSVDFTPDGKHVGSGGVDSNVMVYYMDNHISVIQILGAHPLSTINRVQWLNNDTILSAGHDACIKVWKLFYDAQ